VKEEEGKVFLCSEAESEISGSIKANGSIHIFGETIKIDKDARIDASSPLGNGGKVILWSDESTQFYGDILAQGGNEIGNGGFVEVSSMNYLDFQGFANASAVNGKNGQLLLDPYNVTISAAGDQNITGSPDFYPNGTPSVLKPATIVDLLNAATDVSVSTTGGGGVEDGDITISSAISWTGTGSLTLNADRDININEDITCSTNASFTANAERTINVTSATIQNTYNGDSSFPNDRAIYLNAKGTVAGATYKGININGSLVTSVKGDIKLEGTGGDTDNGNYGVCIVGAGSISSTGSAKIYITAVGGNGVDNNRGL